MLVYRGDEYSTAKRRLHKEIEIMKGVQGAIPVAIVDESHLLNREMLEEVRFLLRAYPRISNFAYFQSFSADLRQDFSCVSIDTRRKTFFVLRKNPRKSASLLFLDRL